MAGTAQTVPLRVKKFWDLRGNIAIKSAEVINNGDLVAIDSNGQMVAASKTQGAVVAAMGVAVFTDVYDGTSARTGVAGLTVRAAMAKRAIVDGALITTTIVPGYAKGARLYLGAVPTATVSNYTGTETSTANDQLQQVGFVNADGDLDIDVQDSLLKYQASASTTVALA